MRQETTSPNLIIHNGRIYQPGVPDTQMAIAVAGGHISAIGKDNDIVHLATPDTRTINADGRWILPALMDSHTHLAEYAERKLQVELSDCNTLPEALSKVKAAVASLAPGKWVVDGGWDKNKWGLPEFPDKAMLDEISNQHFIALQSKDWHSSWVNSNVLKACGISDASADPEGGTILRYPGGREPTGVLQETAREVVLQAIAPPSLDEITPALKETFAEFHRFGITGVHSVESPYTFAIYQRLYDRQEQGLRVFWYFPLRYLAGSAEQGFLAGRGNSFLKICGVKMFTDGALGSQTAHMLENYDGLDHTGIEVLTEEVLLKKIQLAVEQKLSCAIHAIGDAANRKVLRAFGKVRSASRALDLRHRIEHAQLLTAEDISLFAKNNVIASMQPIHLAEDIPVIEKYWKGRGRYAYAFNSLQKQNARLIFGSDTPIESFDPWKGIYSAVARKLHCRPEERSFYPEEAVSVETSLNAYTIDSAYAVSEEMNLGSLTAGKIADLIIIDSDIFSGSAESILQNKVLLTIQDGGIVHENL